MRAYDRLILNALLDSYEGSSLFTGENKRNVHISFPFNRRTVPEYFDESSLAYEEVHACIRMLEKAGFVEIVWKKGREGHIAEKLLLRAEQVPQIYACLKRTPKTQKQSEHMQLVCRLANRYQTPVAAAFLEMIQQRLSQGKTVKEYLDLDHPAASERLVKAVSAIETNTQDMYIREFSIRHFSDSKAFETMQARAAKIFRRFSPRFEDWETEDILAEHFIYHTPNFVYFKGEGTLQLREQTIRLPAFSKGIGISGPDLCALELSHAASIRKVITIENLTTFFRWEDQGSLILYLGGYLNSVRRDFLTTLYRLLPEIPYFHFGDIDVGGFQILENLRQKTGIPFRTYHMDLATLKQYEAYAKELTANDRKRLAALLDAAGSRKPPAPYTEALEYMRDKGIKLEQECVECGLI